MGEYFYQVNLDKGQFIHAHRFGDGLKLGEANNVLTGLQFLLCTIREGEYIGSWCSDRIAVVGDYSYLERELRVHECGHGWLDISKDLIAELHEHYPWTKKRFTYEP